MAYTGTDNVGAPSDYDDDVRPAVGSAYSDAIFNEQVYRLTDWGASPDDDFYGHCFANADGTYWFNQTGSQLDIRNLSDPGGTAIATAQPSGSFRVDILWHPTNKNKYFYTTASGASRGIWERDIDASTNTLAFTVGADLWTLGGSQNWVDKTGRYFVYHTDPGDAFGVYDRVEGVAYSGAVSRPSDYNWAGITPSGGHLIIGGGTMYAYPLNHMTNAIGSANVMRGSGSQSDHGIMVSGSDGKDYGIVTFSVAGGDGSGIYAVECGTDLSSFTLDEQTQQPTVTKLTNASNVPDTWDWHVSHGPNGDGQDWIFIANEALFANNNLGGDQFSTASTWGAFKQEILAINFLTGNVRRLCHHRSRGLNGGYYRLPRTTCAWDSSAVLWYSNFNDSTPSDYADAYAIFNPLGAAEAAPAPRKSSSQLVYFGG